MTAETLAPLEAWVAQHVTDVERLRYAPSFRNRRDAKKLWARLIAESERLEFVPALVGTPDDPKGFWRATELRA